MITGGTDWTTQLNAEYKHTLYVFSIPGLSTQLSSFVNTLLSFTNLTSPGSGSVVLSSVSGGFESWMVGLWFPISAGTHFVAGNYKIAAFVSPTSVQLDSSPTSGGAGSAGVGKVTYAINGDNLLSVLVAPQGPSQKVDELNGHSDLSTLTIEAIDPTGALKALAANAALIGQVGILYMGFPGGDINDDTSFVPIHTVVSSAPGRNQNGLMTFEFQDTLIYLVNQIFLNGGPARWFQLTADNPVGLVSSDAADTRNVTVLGWDTGAAALLQEVVVLTGTTPAFSANTYSSLVSVSTDIVSQLWAVTVSQGAGDVIGGIPIGSAVMGGLMTIPPSRPPKFLDNGYPISSDNPRFLIGNPLDILIAAMQNELGIGQTDPPLLVLTTNNGSGTGQAGYGINPNWTLYNGTTGLINPNTYIDIAALQALQSTDFAGDQFEFNLTDTETGKDWIETEIMRMLGLYWITKANGQLTPKSMKHPTSVSPVSIDNNNIMGVPTTDRWPIINMIEYTIPVSNDSSNTATIVIASQESLNAYKAPYVHPISSAGIRLGHGGFTRMFLLANRIFARHGFGTPIYTFPAFLKHFVLELGDFILLTHPGLWDLKAGVLGVTNVLCEIIGRAPSYVAGNEHVDLTVADTRFMDLSSGSFQIAAVGSAIPDWGAASGAERLQYMFVCNNSGLMSTADPGNEID